MNSNGTVDLSDLQRARDIVRNQIDRSRANKDGNFKFLRVNFSGSLLTHQIEESLAVKLQQYCLSRYAGKFLENNITSLDDILALDRTALQQLEKQIVSSKATLKHKKFAEFIRNTTHFIDYQSVYSNSNGSSPPPVVNTAIIDDVSNNNSPRLSTSAVSSKSHSEKSTDRKVNNNLGQSDTEDHDCDEKKDNDNIIKTHDTSDTFARKYISWTNDGLWSCYNCMEKNNCVVENSWCKTCHLGINPFFYFYSNKVDPNSEVYFEYKSILTKKFGLIKGKNCNVHKHLELDTTSCRFFCLNVDQSRWVTFICENATEFDLQVIIFEYTLYELFGDIHIACLFKPNPFELKYLIDNNSDICGNCKYEDVDVNVRGLLLNGCVARDRLEFIDNNWKKQKQQQFTFAKTKTKTRKPSNVDGFVEGILFARQETAIIELVNEINRNGYERDLLPREDFSGSLQKYPLDISTLDTLRKNYTIFDNLTEKLSHKQHQMMNNVLDAFPVMLCTDGQ